MRHRMIRALVFVLAGWPLLMPPGMCICQFVRAGDVPPWTSEYPCAEDQQASCPDFCCAQGKTNCGPSGNQRMPTDEQCPPGCPANKKADHSRLLEQYHPLAASALAATPLPFFVDFSSGQRLHAAWLTSQASDRPIYLALCTLLI